MTATAGGIGLVPIFHPSGLTRPVRLKDGIDATLTQTIYKGTPVLLNTSGQIVPITDAVWDAAADDIIGVFNGVEYTDGNGVRQRSNKWIGPTTVTGTGDMDVYVWTDPLIVYEARADGPVAATAVGDQFNFAASPDSGNALGLSTAKLAATPAGAGVQGYVRCIGPSNDTDNVFGDAFTKLQVTIAAHEYIADKTAI